MPYDPRKRSIYNKYNGKVLRSLLERSWCEAFDEAGIRWWYEPVRFRLGNRTYLPDFYLRDFDCFAEVKPCTPSLGESFLASMLCERERSAVYFLIGEPWEMDSCRFVYDPKERRNVRFEDRVTLPFDLGF